MVRCVDSKCQAFQQAIAVLGRPWNALLLNVLVAGPMRYSELAERADGPGDKVLCARLKELEAAGLVERAVDPGPPVRVSYALTETGKQFGQVAEAIERWGRSLIGAATPAPSKASARARAR